MNCTVSSVLCVSPAGMMNMCAGDTGGFERELRAPGLPMHTLVCDDVRSGDVENGIDALAKLVDYVPAHPYRVVALRCVDYGGEIGVGVHVSMSVFQLVWVSGARLT